jgi:RNA polymerase sigma-70 factor (ECF subfamily)
MPADQFLTEQFEAHRPHLHAVATRILGAPSEADDALQDAWLRVNRADPNGIENVGGWLTTVVARVCLNQLRARSNRREQLVDPHVPDPVVTLVDAGTGPERQAVLADSVGLALQIVLETLTPAERLAFVLHDMFAVPFDEIATIVDRTPDATRQLASRARRRVQGADASPDADLARQRAAVDAFFAAARAGDLDALVAVLDPDVVLRSDAGPGRALTMVLRGAEEIASRAVTFANPRSVTHPVLVNGDAGVVVTLGPRAVAVIGFTVARGRIVAIEALADPKRLAALDRSPIGPRSS